jgi:hypothetical protein
LGKAIQEKDANYHLYNEESDLTTAIPNTAILIQPKISTLYDIYHRNDNELNVVILNEFKINGINIINKLTIFDNHSTNSINFDK